jgi:hypothetical protein
MMIGNNKMEDFSGEHRELRVEKCEPKAIRIYESEDTSKYVELKSLEEASGYIRGLLITIHTLNQRLKELEGALKDV